MKRIAFVAAVLAVTACGEQKKEAAPAAAAPAAAPAPAPMDTAMKMDTSKKAAMPAGGAMKKDAMKKDEMKKDAKKP